jgi:hypothetical protein
MGRFVLMVLALWFSIASIQAEVVKLPVGRQAQDLQNIDRPHRGMRSDEVEARFGTPENRVGAIGDPPISSWEYKDFVVYFEYGLVLHSVLKHVPIAD